MRALHTLITALAVLSTQDASARQGDERRLAEVQRQSPYVLAQRESPDATSITTQDRGVRRSIQAALNRIGCNAGQPDGVFGPQTIRAIKCFQEQSGHAVTGDLTDAQATSLAAGFYRPGLEQDAQGLIRSEPRAVRSQIPDVPAEIFDACDAVSRWLALYSDAYADVPNAFAFKEQIEQFAEAAKRKGEREELALLFLKLFFPTELKKIFNADYADVDPASKEELIEEFRVCADSDPRFASGPGSVVDYRVLVYSVSEHVAPGQRKGRAKSPISSIARAASELEALRNKLLSARASHSIEQLGADYLSEPLATARRNEIAGALWPEERASFEIELEKARVAFKEQKVVQSRGRCVEEATHPFDPLKPDHIVGSSDEELSTKIDDLLEACMEARAEKPDDPLLASNVGRLLYLQGNERGASFVLRRAEKLGSAAATAYRAELTDDIDDAIALFDQSAKNGFLPAAIMAEELRDYVEAVERYEIERPKIEEQDRARQREVAKRVSKCDRLAAHPEDPTRPSSIRGTTEADIQIEDALTACIAAVETSPGLPRLHYQLGRVLLLIEGLEEEAQARLEAAAEAGHPAAQAELAILSGGTENVDLLRQAAKAGFNPANDYLANLGQMPVKVGVQHLVREEEEQETLLYTVPGSSLQLIEFKPRDCLSAEIEQQRLRNRNVAGDVLMYGMSGGRRGWKSDVQTQLDESYEEQMAEMLCESRKPKQQKCLDLFSDKQVRTVFDRQPVVLRQLISLFNSHDGSIEERLSLMDAELGELTDFITFHYLKHEDILGDEWVAWFDDDYMLDRVADSDLKHILESVKAENKYFIVATTLAVGSVCQ